MSKLAKIMNGSAAGKLTGLTIATIATAKGRRSNSIVGVIAVAGAAYIGKRIIANAKQDYENGIVKEDFLGGLVVGLIGGSIGGAVITGLVGEPRNFPAPTQQP